MYIEIFGEDLNMKTIQAYPEIQYGDAISGVMLAIHRIHSSLRWEDTMMAYASQLPEAKTISDLPNLPKRVLLSRFLSSRNKARLLAGQAKKGIAQAFDYRKAIGEADMRIWHLGITYKLMEHNIRKGDMVFFYGLNYPYASSSPEAIIESYKALLWLRSLQPRMLVESRSVRRELERLGYGREEIRVLPLFHPYANPFLNHDTKEPHLLAYGRYALNKRIPQLARACASGSLKLTVFGDNQKYEEFSQQYAEASKYAGKRITLLGKQEKRELFYWAANIYVCNSENEGFNIPLIEAEAFSLPVLARRGNAMDELVREGYNGYLFEDESEIPELAGRIMKDYKRFSHNAWRHSQGYTLAKFRERYLRMLKQTKA